MIISSDASPPGDAQDFTPSRRADGWTIAAQREFCVAIAAGATVEAAARAQGLSAASAYAFRTTRAGAAFAAGWAAAQLAWRQHLSDLLVSRIVDGQTVTFTLADGSTRKRHYFDNRLAMAMLRRLDLLAAPVPAPATAHAWNLRLRDERRCAANSDAVGRDIVHALDQYFAALEEAPDADPRVLASIARGENADPDSQDSQHSASPDDDTPGEGVWWCSLAEAWMTNFPPPEDADDVDEEGSEAEGNYARYLTGEECQALAHWPTGSNVVRNAHAEQARAAFFEQARCTTPDPGDIEPDELLTLIGGDDSEDES